MKYKLPSTVFPSRLSFAFAASCWLALAPLAQATSYTSIASGSWTSTSASIWSPSGIPGAGDSVTIVSGDVVTNSTGVSSLATVTINSGGSFVVGASVTVTGWLLNNGTLLIANNSSTRTLTMAGNFTNNGSISTENTSQSPANQITFSANALWEGSGDVSGCKTGITVNSGVTLDASGLTTPLKFKSSGTLASTVNGTLITGTQVISGNGNASCSLALGSSGTLATANPNGIINGTTGAFNFLGTVTLPTTANYTFNGTAAQVALGLPATVNNLTISNAAGVTLSAATTVSGTLALNAGVLNTTTSATPTAAAVTSAGSSAYVSGPLAIVFNGTGPEIFPIGANGNSRFVTLNYTSLSGSSTVTVQQFESAMGGTLPASTSQFSSRYWTVSQTGGSGLAYNLTLDGTGFSPSATAVMLEQGSPDTSYATSFSSPYYTATGITTTGNFTLGNYAPSANQLAFTTSSQTLTAGANSGVITVQLQNSGGAPQTATSNITVSLSTTSTGGVFRNSSSLSALTSVTIASGNNSASFKYSDTVAPATPTLTASAAGISPATQLETITVGTAAELGFTGQPGSTNLGATLEPVVVQVEDQYGNPVMQSGTAVTLTLNSASGSVLNGTIPQTTTSAGAATFPDLAVTTAPGTGLTLTAKAAGLTSSTSASFNINSKIIEKALNTTELDVAGSWIGGIEPGTNDTAQIDNSGVRYYNCHGGRWGRASWYGLNIVGWSASHGYIVTDDGGVDVITLGGGGLVGTNLTHSIVFDNDWAITTSETWSWGLNGGFGDLTLNGNIDTGASGYTLTLNGLLSVAVEGSITDTGNVTFGGTGVTLDGANTYTGNTLVNGTLNLGSGGSISGSSVITIAANATLNATGRSDSTLTLASGQTLQGDGAVSGALTTTAGSTLAPGSANAVGTLTVSSVVNLGGATYMKLGGPSISDQIATSYSVSYGGSLVVGNISGSSLAAGETFTLFPGATYAGAFASVALPPLPANLAWQNNLATTGSISVMATDTASPNISSFGISGGNLVLTATNGTPNGSYYLLTTTNLALPVTSWKTNLSASGSFDSSGNLSLTIPLTTNPPAQFYILQEP